MTKQQNAAFYGYLKKLNLTAQKADIVLGASQGRTEKSSELTHTEVGDLLKWFKAQDGEEQQAVPMRRKLIAMAHEMHWHNLENGVHKADMKRIDDWCVKYGYLHKKLDAYKYKELPTLLSQFEQAHKNYLKRV